MLVRSFVWSECAARLLLSAASFTNGVVIAWGFPLCFVLNNILYSFHYLIYLLNVIKFFLLFCFLHVWMLEYYLFPVGVGGGVP